MAHTITMKEIEEKIKQGVSTFTRKIDVPPGRETIAASKVKIGDEVVIKNYFTEVIE